MTTDDPQTTEQEYSTDELDRRIRLIVEDVLDERLGELEETDETIAEHIVDAHEAIDSRIDGVSTRIERLEDRLERDERRITHLEREADVDPREGALVAAAEELERRRPVVLGTIEGDRRPRAELVADAVEDELIEDVEELFENWAVAPSAEEGRVRLIVSEPIEEAIDR